VAARRQLVGQKVPFKRSACLKYEPCVPDSRGWLADAFDWANQVAVVDMFSGAGGLSFGLDTVPGMRVVAAFERDPIACETHAANMPAPVFRGDIGAIDAFQPILHELGVRRVDILAGGPPCQGFSRLGRGALRKIALEDGRGVGLEDERNWLFRPFMRAVREVCPQVVLIENVPAMAEYATVLQEIIEIFAELNYHCEAKELQAQQYGVPQRRSRLFIVATRNGTTITWPEPFTRERTLREAISDLPGIPPDQSLEQLPWAMQENQAPYVALMRQGLAADEIAFIRDHVTRAHQGIDIEAFRHMKEGDRYIDLPPKYRRYRDDIFFDKYHRMVWDEPAWTVTAHIARDGFKYIHPGQPRTLSVREAARIQSFPDRFRFAGYRSDRFRQIGNAVPPLLAEALGGALRPLVQ
jgi:DNA (cytosine-5)-methyltransferase 1